MAVNDGAENSEQEHSGSRNADVDVVVVGAGLGGIYATYRFLNQGLRVATFEGGSGVGGVWFHNRYPGARVDVQGAYYCYFFDPALYKEWVWHDQYPSQVELVAYLNHVTDRYDLRRHITFNAYVDGVQWEPENNFYRVKTEAGHTLTARFVVMTTGQLSRSKTPEFPGLEDFEGQWVLTSHWPEEPVQLKGRRIGVIGTGSSGSQAITAIAPQAEHLYVFQRTPHYSVPSYNRPLDREHYDELAGRAEEVWQEILRSRSGGGFLMGTKPMSDFTPEGVQEQLNKHWDYGGQSINATFTDQGINDETNTVVSNFVRDKIRSIVKDPEVAEKLLPPYPIGTRRLAVDVGFYENFNRDNVTLVDIKGDPIERITKTGIKTKDHHYDLDLIVFAIGFKAFTGSLDAANIRNAEGRQPSDNWARGPKTYLGLMTTDFPNLFTVTGPGSPSVLANMFADTVQHVDYVGDLITFVDSHDYHTVEPLPEAQEEWSAHVQELAQPLIRLRENQYMVHVNEDGTRFFMPYVGGFDRFVRACEDVKAKGYEGFAFT
jgi:cation diffusion facilitator CzcD-associated flavoprotein CzcO